MTPKEISERIEPMVVKSCNTHPGRRFFGTKTGKRLYRGKMMFWVGYTWTRPNAHHFNGLVQEAPVAWGETLDAAIAKLEQKAA